MRAALILLLLLASGCASMSEKECSTADWRQVGFRDGSKGYPRDRIADHEEACGKIGIRADRQAWFDGHDEGLRRYCTPENGLEIGLQGGYYANVCPPALEAGFIERYRGGRAVHDQRALIDSLDRDRLGLERKLEKLEQAERDEERHRLRDQLRDLDYRMRAERDLLMRLESALRRRSGH